MAARAWLLPTPGLPAATRLTASSRKAPLRRRSSCSRMNGGNCSSCRVRKVLSGGKPESRCKRATRCSSRCRHSARTSSYRKASWVRLALAAFSARSSYSAAIAGILRLRSINRISAWRSAMGGLPTEQTVVRIEIKHRRAELGHLLHSWRADQITDGIEGRHDALVEQQHEAGLDLALGGAGGQVQQAHVVPIGAFGGARVQRVVGPAERQAGEQIVAIAVMSECPRLADQRPDDVAGIGSLVAVAQHPWDWPANRPAHHAPPYF